MAESRNIFTLLDDIREKNVIDKNSIAESLKEVLPPGAEVEFDVQRDEFIASFCWLLNNDPKRPFKRSKRVQFVVTPEGFAEPTEKWRIDSLYFLESLESLPGIKRRLF